MPDETSVIARRDRRAGRILLNRPAALNALDLPMIRAITAALAEWRDDPTVHLVIIEGAGPRAFCAGGDIRALRQHQLDGQRAPIDAFFTEEYALNAVIAAFPKPYVALIDGICMGGGIGVSVHAPYRVATEHARFAMPETAIGFFPDIGASYFLPRLPGALGMYLGLTGANVTGAEAVHCGLATHFVPRTDLPALAEALAADGIGALGPASVTPPPSALPRAAIDQSFSAGSIPAVIERLGAAGTGWAAETLSSLRRVSPSALFWTHRLLAEGAGRGLRAGLDAEFALTRTVMAHPDFVEGVRAMVVDKDRAPRWSPERIEAVQPESIAALFR